MKLTLALLFVATLAFAAGCSQYKSASSHDPVTYQEDGAEYTIKEFKNTDPSLNDFFENSAGYAVFPEVGKGAAGIGAAHGEGVLYENGEIIGHVEMTQASIGAQLGGQTYKELIFFENQRKLDEFKQSNTEFAAQASAVAAAKGAAANADYDEGVAVFTLDQQGLMFEASIGGQVFDYTPKKQVANAEE